MKNADGFIFLLAMHQRLEDQNLYGECRHRLQYKYKLSLCGDVSCVCIWTQLFNYLDGGYGNSFEKYRRCRGGGIGDRVKKFSSFYDAKIKPRFHKAFEGREKIVCVGGPI